MKKTLTKEEHEYLMKHSDFYAFAYRRDEFISLVREKYIRPIVDCLSKLIGNANT